MELTRRDAIAALVVGGVGSGALGVAVLRPDDLYPGHRQETDSSAGDDETIIAAADVIYPPEVEGIPAFVREYVSGLPEPGRAGMEAAAERLDEEARQRHSRPFARLQPGVRDDVLHEMDVHVANSDPGGEPAERIRYYLVNELLYALFTSPKGSRLVGIDNPVGYPGGYGSYREQP